MAERSYGQGVVTYTITGIRMLSPNSLSILPPGTAVQCTAQATSQAETVIRSALGRVNLCDALFINVPAIQWMSEVGRYYPGLSCNTVATTFSARVAATHTLMQLLYACATKKRLFNRKTKLAAIFEGFPFGMLLTLGDLVQCANGKHHITLDTIVDVQQSFLRAMDEHDSALINVRAQEAVTWRLPGKLASSSRFEICNVGALRVAGEEGEDDDGDGDFMVVDDEEEDEEEEEEEEDMESPTSEFVSPRLPSPSSEEEEENDVDDWLAKHGYGITRAEIQALPPSRSKAPYIRVAENERGVLSILIPAAIKGLSPGEWNMLGKMDWRQVDNFNCYHVPCASPAQTYEVAWKLYHSRAHDRGAAETRTAAITLYACVRNHNTKSLAKCKERYDKHESLSNFSDTLFPYKDRYYETHPAPGLAINRPYESSSDRRVHRELRNL